ncbi:MAG: hypothetical protein AB7T59_04650 [Hyphomonadaceae bacterium]
MTPVASDVAAERGAADVTSFEHAQAFCSKRSMNLALGLQCEVRRLGERFLLSNLRVDQRLQSRRDLADKRYGVRCSRRPSPGA